MFKYHVLESHVQYSNLFWENNDRPLGMKLILPCKTQSNKKQAENSDFLEMRLKQNPNFFLLYHALYDIFLLYVFCITFDILGVFGNFLLSMLILKKQTKQKKSFVHNILR